VADSVYGVIEPHGPLPPEVYWRRRILAGVIALGVVAVIIGLIVWTTTGDESKSNGAKGSTSASASASKPPARTTEPADESIDERVTGGGTGGGGGAAAGETVRSRESGTARPSGSTTSAPGPVPASGLCPDENISVVLYTDKPTYTVGSQPVFTIVVTNAGLSECTRDVGKSAQDVVVRTLDGTRTLWTARDCSPVKTPDNRVLKPAQQVRDTITWSGTTSNPGCNKPRVPVPAGQYQAIGKIGQKESSPITFNMVNPASN
jgi:hypothetical protein